MAETSSYTKYLPPILWSKESDPTLFLARMLRIFEHILTGIPLDAAAMEAEADIISASGTQIQVSNVTQAKQFQAGDLLTIVGTQERVWVKNVNNNQIFLVNPLRSSYGEEKLRLSADNYLTKTIDKIPHLLNPWRTPPEFLPWLASWLALEFQPEWSEYQQRRFISDILSIYQQRGLKQGLLTYLDIYASTAENPRIAIDDGEAVLRAELTGDGELQLKTVAYSRVVGNVAVLLHPSANAVDNDKNYIIAHRGGEVENKDLWQPALWKISSSGEIPYQSGNPLPLPQPIYSGKKIKNPTAIVVQKLDQLNHYYVLSIGEQLLKSSKAAIHSLTGIIIIEYDLNLMFLNSADDLPTEGKCLVILAKIADFYHARIFDENGNKVIDKGKDEFSPDEILVQQLDKALSVQSNGQQIDKQTKNDLLKKITSSLNINVVINQTTTPKLPAIHPVDMVLDASSETSRRFIILDRGSHPPFTSQPKLFIVSVEPSLAVEEHPLTDVVEPTALVRDTATGHLIIADAKEPSTNDSAFSSADLLRVDPNDNWSITSLLGNLPLAENPLIFPTGLAWESPLSLIVCDKGVRERAVGDNSNRHRAEPAGIYRVDLSHEEPKITQISYQQKLVHPSDIAIDLKGNLLVTDRGSAYNIQGQEREWRARPNEFGVVVLFSQQRPTSLFQRNKIRFDIANVINGQKAAHTSWSMRSL